MLLRRSKTLCFLFDLQGETERLSGSAEKWLDVAIWKCCSIGHIFLLPQSPTALYFHQSRPMSSLQLEVNMGVGLKKQLYCIRKEAIPAGYSLSHILYTKLSIQKETTVACAMQAGILVTDVSGGSSFSLIRSDQRARPTNECDN